MKVKKRYYVACILMCIAALALSVAVFNLEMGLATYSKLNKVVQSTWIQTSQSDPLFGGLDTRLRVTEVVKDADMSANPYFGKFGYIGKRYIINGKYTAYGKEVYGSNILVNSENGEEIKPALSKFDVYYKPDNPLMVYIPVKYSQYLILILAVLVIAIVMIIICRLLNKSLKDSTFSDSTVTMMDIPMAVIVVSIILAFFAGMLIGNLRVNDSYSVINEGLAQQYANHELFY